ncbi:protein trichome birefringence-like 1 [Curcuma longa]|uniref:protein trichome birefringence-like 1 n=1 Tax=Curcuma longa TaxID=136217 RepID=UPI003D9E3D7C
MATSKFPATLFLKLKSPVQFLCFPFPSFYTALFSFSGFLLFLLLLLRHPQPPPILLLNRPCTVAAPSADPAPPPFSSPPPPPPPPPEHAEDSFKKGNTTTTTTKKHCDLFDGRWVRDEGSPSYPPGSCRFVDVAFDCFGNGRKDLNYTKMRWKPNGCTLPRLRGEKMLKLLRGKRLAFVGDSLNRNMWESLLCILTNSLDERRRSRVFEVSGRSEFRSDTAYAVRFADYNCSIEFFRAPFLVRESSSPGAGGNSTETLRLDLMEAAAEAYADADVLVFNSGHWWTHTKTSKGENFYQEGDHVFPKLSAEEAYRRALKTWANWVRTRIDPSRTRVFFRGYSWSHFNGGQWNSGGNCDGETEPIVDEKHLARYLKLTEVLESEIAEMNAPLLYLNITRMTDYRKDAHPSVYRSPEAARKPGEAQDCSHWCLPGVPDAWNELLYAMLLRSSE